MSNMKAIVKVKPGMGKTEFQSIEIPHIKFNEVLIKVKVAAICGTDVHIYNWDKWAQNRIKTPLVYGHEFSGEVVEIGKDVTHVKVGDYVSGEGHIACNHCYQCRIGLAHVCENSKIIGVDINGIFAEYAAIPASNVWANHKDLSPELASIQDPLGNAIHTVFAADVPGRKIAIFGCGPIGLMAIAICKAIGAAQIFAIGRKNQYRLDLAKKLGADFVLKSDDTLYNRVMVETDGHGVDVVLEISGSNAALNQGLKVLRTGGGVYLLGIYPDDTTINLSEDVVFKYSTIQGINGRLMYDTWYRMAGLLKSGNLNIEPIITHKFKFDEFEEAMNTMRSGNCGKVVMYM